jgi:hypothetical protein
MGVEPTRGPDEDGADGEDAVVRSRLAAVDAALATGDLAAAMRAWHEVYGATMGSRRWEGFADAGDAYLRIARASGSPADGLARARDLYLSALLRASGAGSLDGVLRIASVFAELGDDEIVTHSLRIARRLAGSNPVPGLRDRLSMLEGVTRPTPDPMGVRGPAARLH